MPKAEYYVRTGSTNQRLTGAALDRFMLRSYGRTWDSVPHPTVSVRDADRSLLEEFRELARAAGRLAEGDLKESDVSLLQELRLEDCRSAGTPQPQPAFEANGVWMTFPFLPEHTAGIESRLDSDGGSEKSSEKIMEMIRRDPEVTIAEMSEEIGKSSRAVEKQLAKLRKAGSIKRKGPDKGGRWYVTEHSYE
ncbi:MAG: winged helix-turn-helix transcriptional regulator [Spirochaetes bacterium]|jgi:predicted HTH transcriptional regulator|nr:winged helix-turn-helix transcriptional regulator [Spirochaetota bacterium]